MEEKKKNKQYSAEFKSEAVAKCLKIGIKQTCEELGLKDSTLRGWLAKSEKCDSKGKEKPSYHDLEKEVRRLRKELGYVSEINKVLKKSTAIFSSHEMGGLR